jgi:hypothetical protein
MDLRRGHELVDEKERDLSGRKSHLLEHLRLDVRDTSRGNSDAALTADVSEPWVSIYPNPAVYATNVDAQKVPAGNYRVVLTATNGAVYARQDVSVDESGQLFRTFDLRDVPSGYYIVQIHETGRPIGTYPIVILH